MGMKHIKIKRAFSKILISYLIVLLLPLVLVGILMEYTNNKTAEDCKRAIHSGLQKEVLQFEHEIDTMEDAAKKLYANNRLRYIAQQDGMQWGDKNISKVLEFHEELNHLFMQSDFYQDYALILSNGYIFRNAGITMGKEAFFNYYRSYEELDYERWAEESFMRAEPFFFPMQRIQVNDWAAEYLTFCYPVAVLGSRDITASLQLLIPRKRLEHLFLSRTDEEGAGVYLFDRNGQCILTLGKAGEPEAFYHQLDLKNSQGDLECELDGRTWMVCHQRSEKSGLTLVFAAPSSQVLEASYSFRNLSIFLMVLLFAIELYLGISFARKYAMPIRNVLSNIERFMTEEKSGIQEKQEEKPVGDAPANEYEYLEDQVEKLLITGRKRREILRKNKLHEKLNYLSLLFHGEFQSHELAVEEAKNTGICFTGNLFSVCSLTGGEGLQEALEHLEEPWKSAVAAVRSQNEGKAELLWQFTGLLSDQEYLEFMESFYQALAQKVEGLRMGCGGCYSDLTDLDDSFRQAAYCLRYAKRRELFFADYASVTEERNDPWYPRELEEKLRNTVKNGNEETIGQIMEKICQENIRKRSLEIRMETVLRNQMIATLITIGKDMILGKRLDEYLRDLYKEKSLSDMLSKLEEIFKEICRDSQMTKKPQEELYAERLNQYLEDNYGDKMLSVCMAAEAFSLSEGYFSRFFKKMMGRSFSDCLEELRLKKAKELMRDTEATMEEIAGKVGYGNDATFRRAFKRVYGIAPNQWKQTMKEEDGERNG